MLRLNFGNAINGQRVVAIVNPESAPIRKIISQKLQKDHIIDATMGRKTRAAIFLDSGQVVKASVDIKTLVKRWEFEVDRNVQEIKKISTDLEWLIKQLKCLGGVKRDEVKSEVRHIE